MIVGALSRAVRVSPSNVQMRPQRGHRWPLTASRECLDVSLWSPVRSTGVSMPLTSASVREETAVNRPRYATADFYCRAHPFLQIRMICRGYRSVVQRQKAGR